MAASSELMSPEPTERGTAAGEATRLAILSAICRA